MKYVAYYRSSIGKQKDGLSTIQEQKTQVRTVVDLVGQGEIIAEYQDIETSDKTNKRAELEKALYQARKAGAVIVVSSFDRISHNVNFITSLMNSDVTFASAERLSTTRSVLRVFASFTHEAQTSDSSNDVQGRVAQRTRYAMKMLSMPPSRSAGSHNLTAVAQQKGAQAVKQKALENPANKIATSAALDLRKQGKNLTEIASLLNKQGITTAKGKQFQPVQVLRLLERADETHRVDRNQGDLFE